MTLLDVRKLLDTAGLRYYLSPDQEAVMVGVIGPNGRYQFVVNLQADGNFLQFRSVGFLQCAPDHPHLPVALKAIAHTNYSVRGVKIGWDPGDGEIVVYSDVWVFDGTITSRQFGQTLFSFMQVLDVAHLRISGILATGEDPGNESPEQILRKLLSGIPPGTLPEELAKLLRPPPGSPGGDTQNPPGPSGQSDDFSQI